jgi:hypothetical protein
MSSNDDHLMVTHSLIDLRRGNGSGKESIDENLEDGCNEGTATSEEPIRDLGIYISSADQIKLLFPIYF